MPRPYRRQLPRAQRRLCLDSSMGLAASLLLTTALLVLDVAEGPEQRVMGVSAAAPMLCAVMSTPAATALSAVYATAAVYGHGLLTGAPFDTTQQLLVGVTAAIGVVAVAAAHVRRARDRQLDELTTVAEIAQATVLRPVPAFVAGIGAAVSYTSAHAAARVGGDCYEVLNTPFGLRAIVGDVRGKGLPAVRHASHTVAVFREEAHRAPDLAALARAIDASLTRDACPERDAEDFVTAVLLEVDPTSMVAKVACCGHPLPLVRSVGGTIRELPAPPDVPLGLGARPEVTTHALAGGDRILLYTDGLSEARRGEVFLDVPATAEAALSATTLADALAALTATARKHTRGKVRDDMALVALELPRP